MSIYCVGEQTLIQFSVDKTKSDKRKKKSEGRISFRFEDDIRKKYIVSG